MISFDNLQVVIIGLGYVGLPLAVEFGKKYCTLGVDINEQRVRDLAEGLDSMSELNYTDIKSAIHLLFSTTLSKSNLNFKRQVFIITVPTPINHFKKPDLSFLRHSTRIVGGVLKKGDIVIYESTVYPGCTEEECVPILESESGLVFNRDFYCGYSPERINPGDKLNTFTHIKKITSGSTPEIAHFIDNLYKSVVTAGTYLAPSMKVAEAAKIVENCQRDVNISFMNEISQLLDKLAIDTDEVLEAASTKWNFMRYEPGLVGGHCIGIDPYYLLHKAEQVDFFPSLIHTARTLNDGMDIVVANKIIRLLIQRGISVKGGKLLMVGVTYKKNCSDSRNSRIFSVIDELEKFGLQVTALDPRANTEFIQKEYGRQVISEPELLAWSKNSPKKYDIVIIHILHDEFANTCMSLINKAAKVKSNIFHLSRIMNGVF